MEISTSASTPATSMDRNKARSLRCINDAQTQQGNDVQTGGREIMPLHAMTEQLSTSTIFEGNANAGSQIGHNTGSIVNHFYGSASSNDHVYRAPKRRKMDQTRASNAQDHLHTTREDGDRNEQTYNSLHKSLLFDRMDFRVNNIRKALVTTCEWLLTHPDFRKWCEDDTQDGQNGFLWIKGKPGCGKSTLMKAALDHTRRRIVKAKEKQLVIPYFFNARAPALLEKSSQGLYRTIVYQLLSSHQSLQNIFMHSFARKDPRLPGNWTREELQGFLDDAVDSNADFKLVLFIDALDEAEYEDDVRDMIMFLVQLADRAIASGGSSHIRVCLSSRHYPHISIDRGCSLKVEEQPGHSQDIQKYIYKQLICQESMEKDNLSDQIFSKSARVFLWVVLVVGLLNQLNDRGAPVSDMRARLNTIPTEIDKLFCEILTKNTHDIESSILLFQWMVFGLRALEPGELFLAIEYSKAPNEPTQVRSIVESVPSTDRLMRFILDCSRGLVEVVEIAPSKPPIVQFIHETVREFLINEKGLISIIPALGVNLDGISHEILRTACSRCVSAKNIPTVHENYQQFADQTYSSWQAIKSDVRHKLPFLDYAASYVFDHAEQAQTYGVSQQAFLNTQIHRSGSWSDSYRLWWNLLQCYEYKRIGSRDTFLYFAIQQQYSSMLPVILGILDNGKIDCGHYGITLELASRKGVSKVVRWLMETSVDVNAWGRSFVNAVESASGKGHAAVIEALLKNNAQGADYDNALCIAVASGYEKVVQILLDKGADVNAQERGLYGSALQAASANGYEKIVRILLDKGAEIDVQGGLYGNPVRAALVNRYEKVAQMLLQKGAERVTTD